MNGPIVCTGVSGRVPAAFRRIVHGRLSAPEEASQTGLRGRPGGQTLLTLALAAVLGAGATGAMGQQPKQPKQPQQPKPPPIEVVGTVDQVALGGITVTSPANETWLVQIPPTAKVDVTGTGEPDLLQPGRFVRLTAMVDKRGHVSEPVHQMTLIDVADRPGRRPGAFPPGQDEPPVPGAKAAAPGVQMPMPDMSSPPPGGDQVMLDIRGQIKSYRTGQMILEVPGRKSTLRLELADSLTVALDVSDYRLAQPGDRFTSKGVQIAEKAAQANEVTIVLSAPVTDPKKRPDRPEPPRQPARTPSRPSQDEEERNPFEVAQQMRQGEDEKEPEPPAAAVPPQGAAPPEEPVSTSPPKPAQTSQHKTDELLAMLTPEPDSTTRPDIRVRLGDAPPITLTPCKPGVTRVDLRREFGDPDKVYDVRGELPIGRGRALQPIQWEMWEYGQARLFLNRTGMVWYRQAR